MKRSIIFSLSTTRTENKTKLFPIRMRISMDGDRIDLNLGYSIYPHEWDKATHRAIPGVKTKNGPTTNEINRVINNSITALDDFFLRFDVLKKRNPTKNDVKSFMRALLGRGENENEQKNTFSLAYIEFTNSMGKRNNWTRSTYQKFATLKGHLLRFKPNISFDDMNDDTLQGFVDHLYSLGMRNTSVSKILSFLRWFLRWAYNNDLYSGKSHITMKPRMKGTEGYLPGIIYLDWNEVIRLLDFDFQKKSLANVRDVFCFCCFTGLRYSDVAKLKKTDIKNNKLYIVTQKTSEALCIELNNNAKKILDKYSNTRIMGGLALPVVSNPKTNKNLKEIGLLVGLDTPTKIVYFIKNKRIEEIHPKYELLTTHCARRTFVVTSLLLGIPAEVIMSWTGHSDYQSMKPYIAIVDPLKKKEMNKFNTMTPDYMPNDGM